MEEIGQIEFEIITGEGEHYDLWLSEKELRLADDGIAGAFAKKKSHQRLNFTRVASWF